MMNYHVSWKCCLMLWSLRLWHCLPELWARRGITSSLDKSVICAQLNTFLMLPDCSLSRYDWSSHLWLTWLGILFIWWSGHLSFISVTMDVHVLGCPFHCAGWAILYIEVPFSVTLVHNSAKRIDQKWGSKCKPIVKSWIPLAISSTSEKFEAIYQKWVCYKSAVW